MVSLKEDQEVLLFLKPHHSGEFQVIEAYFDVVHDAQRPEDVEVEQLVTPARPVKQRALHTPRAFLERCIRCAE